AASAAGELRQQPVVHLDLLGLLGPVCVETLDDAADVRMQLRRLPVIVDPQCVEAWQNSLNLGDVERRPVSKDADGRLRQRSTRKSREIEDSFIEKRFVVAVEREQSGKPMRSQIEDDFAEQCFRHPSERARVGKPVYRAKAAS